MRTPQKQTADDSRLDHCPIVPLISLQGTVHVPATFQDLFQMVSIFSILK